MDDKNRFSLDNYNYVLPEELIAQEPEKKRDNSKLLVVDKSTGELTDRRFYNIVDYLEAGDLLVLNNTKVFPARLLGKKYPTGGGCEVVLHRQHEQNVWKAIVRPGRKLPVGTVLEFGDGKLMGEIIERYPDGERLIRFSCDGDFFDVLNDVGHVPLPPYISRSDGVDDRDRYQTVYAKERGAVAAPTAGFHFTPELLKKISDKGVITAEITLHVGLGTFQPIKVKDIREHKMHSEFIVLSQKTADLINETKTKGKRIVAVGTTTVRTLESVGYPAKEFSGFTGIFIYPPYSYKVVDCIITNFHLPGTSLIVMISAFAGRDMVLKAYSHAVSERYRFYSYGDSMLIK